MNTAKPKKSHRIFVSSIADFPDEAKKIVEVNGLEIGVFYVDGEFYAWVNVCPHAGAPVCEGVVGGTRTPSEVYSYEYGRDQEILRCPWHGWEFDLKTGEHLVQSSDGKRGTRLKGFPVKVEAGNVYLLLPFRFS